jgi:hypothetical protein
MMNLIAHRNNRILAGVGTIALLYGISTLGKPAPAPPKSVAPPIAAASPTPSVPIAQVNALFGTISHQQGYRPQVIEWGCNVQRVCGQALTVPVKAWFGLSLEQKNLLQVYAQQQSLRAIIVGQVKDSAITLDKTVWGE